MITRLLIANRGEISQRIIRTCAAAGVSTVAVFSDADAESPHVRAADLAVHLPGNAPADTYLRADLIVAAALRSGADAVHPGYGFLSENAPFARAVIDAGLTWVGPPPEAIEAMGSKVTAKKLMADAGVPVLSESGRFPMLVKASAGGGGRGMRIVRSAAELEPALESARREAESAFGDPTVFTEPYIESGRHIEVQLLADSHGTIWTLGERECSIQRRHQKVIEETPSPFVGPGLREKLFDAARRAAQAIGYVGAGTVEFLVEPSGKFFFLEVNTRLQVEHPVTEAVYGVDLVALQLAIAEGAALPATPPEPVGHAIEARLYAEDPANGWRPQSGVLHRFAVPGDVRVDSGVEDGSVITTNYDPMLAKVIAHAPTRLEAARKLATALQRARIHGPITNRDLLVRVLRHDEFLAGGTDTGFLTRHDLTAPLLPPEDVQLAALAAALAGAARRRTAAPVQRTLPAAWRNVPSQPQETTFEVGAERLTVAYPPPTPPHRTGLFGYWSIEPSRHPAITVTVREVSGDEVALERDGVVHRFTVHTVGDVSYVDGPHGAVALVEATRFPEPGSTLAPGSLLAPMPGTVGRVHVEEGATVVTGQLLLTMEAMKMEHPVAAPRAGTVRELNVQPGRQVEAGAVLAVITEEGR